ncbi:membrane cofactor protein-like isoform X5 [Varanus komodoensis]|uniref:membrane cofactor protein-like isoform X5 n=1 Tax=Varanus komodoensis TaxID=61221 RepID=UPI001CF7B773|nr:membrane cofactor protein-like isoform X5 [Varanus komodoensis]
MNRKYRGHAHFTGKQRCSFLSIWFKPRLCMECFSFEKELRLLRFMDAATMRLLPCGSSVRLLRWALLVLPLLSSEVLGDCGPPDPPLYAEVRNPSENGSYSVGTVVQFRCITGYENIPGLTTSTKCLDTSKWQETAKFCKPRKCRPQDLENGRIESTGDLELGSEIIFSCNDGYRLVGQEKARCVVTGNTVSWSGAIPFCQPILCYPPPVIPNGTHSGTDDEYSFGNAVTYRCDAGFSLIGSASISCSVKANGVDGEWKPNAPECKDVRCNRPQIPNGRVASTFQSTYLYDNIIRIECDPHHTLQGSDFIKCGADSKWKPDVPTCVKITVTTTTATTTTIHSGDKKDETTRTTQKPDVPDFKDKPGHGKAIGIAVGIVVAVAIAAVVITIKFKDRCIKGKNASSHESHESYRPVMDKDVPMKVKEVNV